MADKVFRINSATDAKLFAKAFAKGIAKPVLNAKPYFQILGNDIDTGVQQQFKNQGAAGGPRRIESSKVWAPFSASVFGKKRYGTDKNTPELRKSTRRRYTPASRLLQASGQFRKSFKTVRTTKKGVKYQTVHKLGGKVGSNPLRPVLFVTDFDLLVFNSKWQKFIDRGIKF